MDTGEVAIPGPSGEIWARLLRLFAGPEDDFDDDLAFELVAELQRRGEPEVMQWALPLLNDPDRGHRQAAAWVLGQHGYERGRPFGNVVAPALAAAARREQDPEVRADFVTALGFTEDPDQVPTLLHFATDPAAEVRVAVARQLPGLFGGEELTPEAVQVLIDLSRDEWPYIRDWATMRLGSSCDLDTPAIRQALHDRLYDYDTSEEDEKDHGQVATAGEALLGLARRHDPVAYGLLVDLLHIDDDDDVHDIGNIEVEAAGELGDPRLLPALLTLRAAGWADGKYGRKPRMLAQAIDALQNEQEP